MVTTKTKPVVEVKVKTTKRNSLGNLYAYTEPEVKVWVVEQAKKKGVSTSEYISTVFVEKYNRSTGAKLAGSKKTSSKTTKKTSSRAAKKAA